MGPRESSTDPFRCTEGRVYEVVARDTDGPIKPCTGLVGYGGDTERVYLLLTQNPALQYSHAASLATSVRSTGIGRAPRFLWRDGRLLVESAPTVVAELARRIELITSTIEDRQVPASPRSNTSARRRAGPSSRRTTRPTSPSTASPADSVTGRRHRVTPTEGERFRHAPVRHRGEQ